jgi:hypothetical protein
MGRKIGAGIIILIAVLMIAAFLLRQEPPPIPRDPVHLTSMAAADREAACLACHGPAGKNRRPATHPSANDCFRCHELR